MRVETIVPPINKRVLEAWDETSAGGFGDPGRGAWFPYGYQPGVSATATAFWDGIQGAAPARVHPSNGFFFYKMTSALNSQNGLMVTTFGIPLTRRYGVAPAIAPAAGWPLRKYYFACIAWREAITASTPYRIGIGQASPLEANGTLTGYDVVSDAALNAGRWTLRSRLANGGALTVDLDTGLDPLLAPLLFEFIYTESLAPTLEVKIGGISQKIYAGQAQMVSAAAPGASKPRWIPQVFQGVGAGSIVGAIDWLGGGHYYLEDQS